MGRLAVFLGLLFVAFVNCTTFTVYIGNQVLPPEPGKYAGAWRYSKFYPQLLTVNVGDEVTFVVNDPLSLFAVIFTDPSIFTLAPSYLRQSDFVIVVYDYAIFPMGGTNVTNVTGLYSTGVLGADPRNPTQYTFTMGAPGSYRYFNTYSGGMFGFVTVQAAGSTYPETPASYDADAHALMATDAARVSQFLFQYEPIEITTGPDGAPVHNIIAGWGTIAYGLSYSRYYKEDYNITVGDWVNWTVLDPYYAHTVTFNTSGQFVPLQYFDDLGELVFDPAYPFASADYVINQTSGFINSGFMASPGSPAGFPPTALFKFTEAGVYPYLCMLHNFMGMTGIISVYPPGVLPSTTTTTTTGETVLTSTTTGTSTGSVTTTGTTTTGKSGSASLDVTYVLVICMLLSAMLLA